MSSAVSSFQFFFNFNDAFLVICRYCEIYASFSILVIEHISKDLALLSLLREPIKDIHDEVCVKIKQRRSLKFEIPNVISDELDTGVYERSKRARNKLRSS